MEKNGITSAEAAPHLTPEQERDRIILLLKSAFEANQTDRSVIASITVSTEMNCGQLAKIAGVSPEQVLEALRGGIQVKDVKTPIPFFELKAFLKVEGDGNIKPPRERNSKTLHVFRCINSHPDGTTLNELSDELGIPRKTVVMITTKLTASGSIILKGQGEHSRFFPKPKLT